MQPLIGDSWHLARHCPALIHNLNMMPFLQALALVRLRAPDMAAEVQACFEAGSTLKELAAPLSKQFRRESSALSSAGSEKHDSKAWNIVRRHLESNARY